MIRGGAHLFQVERPGTFNRTVVEFLDRVTAQASLAELSPLAAGDR